MAPGGDIDNTWRGSATQRGEYGRRKDKRAEMVGGKVRLVAIFGQLSLGDRHDACVVDEDVDRDAPRFDLFSGLARLSQRSQINDERFDLDVGGELGDCFLRLAYSALRTSVHRKGPLS